MNGCNLLNNCFIYFHSKPSANLPKYGTDYVTLYFNIRVKNQWQPIRIQFINNKGIPCIDIISRQDYIIFVRVTITETISIVDCCFPALSPPLEKSFLHHFIAFTQWKYTIIHKSRFRITQFTLGTVRIGLCRSMLMQCKGKTDVLGVAIYLWYFHLILDGCIVGCWGIVALIEDSLPSGG